VKVNAKQAMDICDKTAGHVIAKGPVTMSSIASFLEEQAQGVTVDNMQEMAKMAIRTLLRAEIIEKYTPHTYVVNPKALRTNPQV